MVECYSVVGVENRTAKIRRIFERCFIAGRAFIIYFQICINKNAVVVFDSVFVFLDVRDNDCSGYEDARTKFERKACPVAQI